jgi:hypothetical protein
MQAQLLELAAHSGLSADVADILERALA